VYGAATVDNRGRVTDCTVVAALGWRPGTRVSLRVAGRSVLITEDAAGELAVTDRGRIHLPATVRHAVALATGEKVLLAASPDARVLAVHPPAALDALIPRPAAQAPAVAAA
jgi:bifunctional DNA-binding transcriptional regulator/antitoxin component of YhaV-PrlF toxin-antitoxin module